MGRPSPPPTRRVPARRRAFPERSRSAPTDGRWHPLATYSTSPVVGRARAQVHRPPLNAAAAESKRSRSSPDGRTLASADRDTTIQLWNVVTRMELRPPLTGHGDAVQQRRLQPGRAHAGIRGDDTTIGLWDTHTHMAARCALRGHTNSVNTSRSAPTDEPWRPPAPTTRSGCGTCGPTGSAAWRARCIADAFRTSVAFSPDGRTLASARRRPDDRAVGRCTARPLGGHRLTGHARAVNSVA